MKKSPRRPSPSASAKRRTQTTRRAKAPVEPPLDSTTLSALGRIAAALLARGRSAKGARARLPSISVLFTEANPSGHRQAAEVLAREVGLHLLRIDLGAVVSANVVETERNLGKIFTATKRKPAVLFFDEADALFGKKSAANDSHDRYANLEVSYLLDRIEAFSGISILSTNRKANIDAAFLRRLHYIVAIPPV